MPPKFDLAKTKPIVRVAELEYDIGLGERRDIATSGSEVVPHARDWLGMAIRQPHTASWIGKSRTLESRKLLKVRSWLGRYPW